MKAPTSKRQMKATKCADVSRMKSVIGIARKELARKSAHELLEELRGPVSFK